MRRDQGRNKGRCRGQWWALWLGVMLLSINPSHAYITVLGSLEREFQVQPGDQHRGQIEVQNPGSQPLRVRAYLEDFDPRPDGLGFQPPPAHPRSNAGWISLMPSEQTIAAGARAIVDYTIVVPPDLDMDGSFWSVIMIEADDQSDWPVLDNPVARDPTQVTMGIRHVLRTAVRVVTTAGGRPNLTFVERSLSAPQEGQAIALILGNDGTANLHLTLHADLFDAQGQPLGRVAPRQSITRVLPGAQITRHLTLPALPRGEYQAVVIADHRGEHLFGARYAFQLDTLHDPQVAP
jgi:hypothetical protein